NHNEADSARASGDSSCEMSNRRWLLGTDNGLGTLLRGFHHLFTARMLDGRVHIWTVDRSLVWVRLCWRDDRFNGHLAQRNSSKQYRPSTFSTHNRAEPVVDVAGE